MQTVPGSKPWMVQRNQVQGKVKLEIHGIALVRPDASEFARDSRWTTRSVLGRSRGRESYRTPLDTRGPRHAVEANTRRMTGPVNLPHLQRLSAVAS